MKEIPLRTRDGSVRGYAIVDDSHFLWLNQWRWHMTNHGYAARVVRVGPRKENKVRSIKMHRVVLGIDGEPGHADHINGDRLDNRIANLRVLTQAQNSQNRSKTKGATSSRYLGVDWHKATRKWRARVTLAGKQHALGFFDLEEDAALTAHEFRAENMPYSRAAGF